ncbi:hypothetical protein SNK05_002136 [Fusarium graminearum]
MMIYLPARTHAQGEMRTTIINAQPYQLIASACADSGHRTTPSLAWFHHFDKNSDPHMADASVLSCPSVTKFTDKADRLRETRTLSLSNFRGYCFMQTGKNQGNFRLLEAFSRSMTLCQLRNCFGVHAVASAVQTQSNFHGPATSEKL